LSQAGGSLAQVAALLEVTPGALSYWFDHKGSTTSPNVLDGLARLLVIPYAQALREAGGKTSKDLQRELAVERAAKHFPAKGSVEASKQASKAAQARRGTQRPADTVAATIAKMLATRTASGGEERSKEALRVDRTSPKGRARRSLITFLFNVRTPSAAQLADLAARTGKRLNLKPAAVRGVWHPYLRARGLVGAGGRHRMDDRYALVIEVRQAWPRVGASQRLAPGVWHAAAERVSVLENSAIDGPALEMWFNIYEGRLLGPVLSITR
jgi:hypothetical protein